MNLDAQAHAQPTRRSGGGCLGCLGCLPRLLLLGVALYAAMLVMFGLLAPWNLYFGGHFHPMGGWQGWGRLHSESAGGDYFMWIRLGVTMPALRISPITGVAYLCTPRGEHFHLNLGGSMPREHGTDLTGVPLHFYMSNRGVFNISADHRPYIDLYGSFGDSQLIMEDHGSLANAFNRDGSLSDSRQRNRPRSHENIQVTFKESTPWVLVPSCPKSLD